MQKRTISISFDEYASLEELNSQDQILCLEAKNAMSNSHSPYSGFRVGVAVQLESGRIVHGSNQENMAYPSGLCAERVALFMIGTTYPNDKIRSMAITAETDNFLIKEPVTSCGACLQVMAEYEKKQAHLISVMFYCLNGTIIRTTGIKSLLPFAFDETRLQKYS
jgi:cytidine deaminase